MSASPWEGGAWRPLWAGCLSCLTEGEDIKKRWQEYTEELYKKDLHGPDNHDGVITHLEPRFPRPLPGTLGNFPGASER